MGQLTQIIDEFPSNFVTNIMAQFERLQKFTFLYQCTLERTDIFVAPRPARRL